MSLLEVSRGVSQATPCMQACLHRARMFSCTGLGTEDLLPTINQAAHRLCCLPAALEYKAMLVQSSQIHQASLGAV